MHSTAFTGLGLYYRLTHGYYPKVAKAAVPLAISVIAIGVGVAYRMTRKERA
jgi:hypothetical protein